MRVDVREAVDLSHARQASLPSRYRAFRDAFGEAPGGPERPLVYETISPLQATFGADPKTIDREVLRIRRDPEPTTDVASPAI